MTPEINQAIEALYHAFGDAPPPGAIEACPCCHEPAEYCDLTRLPLRELTHEHLYDYAFSVFYTVGDRPDFEYLFPRILELSTQDDDFGIDREIVFKKPRLAGWPADWRVDRQKAFQGYLDAVIASFGNHAWTDGDDLDSWVCCLGLCMDDLAQRLDGFLSDTPVAAANLILFYEANRDKLDKRRLANAFWDCGQSVHDQVVLWFAQPEVQKRIQEAYEMVALGQE